MEHQYSWFVDEHNVMTVWEDNRVLATLEDCYEGFRRLLRCLT